ncbi:helicase DnaB [Paenibacillus sp. PAMC21692]|uniref:helicase DnaB n=1 Tax=Paenibacillus sp. PAMC21692 TaxID=2762320 RepID=UPI00164DF38B|nr:helicase DnaB [Paenibacillus sp. PAMC21692]QNK56123.1 helicase DnaB [Paenibacillus sp. PAMC21692]
MRIQNILQFTEHHRYYIFRGFTLSSTDDKMLSLIYQPMVGAFAIALYRQLYHGVPEDRTGYSRLEPQRRLFLGLGLEMNEQSRKFVVEQTSKLEAVGLLQTSRLGGSELAEVVYEYELEQPLSPIEFFRNMHLAMLLRDKIGKYAVIELRESFGANEPDELAGAELTKENISVPFYELFKLNMQSFDTELEQALTEVAPTRQAVRSDPTATAGIPYGELILHFPRSSGNRAYVERLRGDADAMSQVNYVAYKYALTVVNVCRLLDESGVFDAAGKLNVDELQLKASSMYRQDRKREDDRQRVLAKTKVFEEPEQVEEEAEEVAVAEQDYLPVPNALAGRCDIQQYNMLMRNEPHTRFIRRFFPGAIPGWLEQVMERIDLNYRLAEPVINVLIHYVIGGTDDSRITKAFLDHVASNMLMKGVDSFEKAVQYVRLQAQLEQDKEKRKEASAGSGGGYGGGRAAGNRGGSGRPGISRKPSIPIVGEAETSSVSAAELEELRKLARKLDGKG